MKVLLVEDDGSLRRTLRVTLEALGHAVSEAATGEAAAGRSPAPRTTRRSLTCASAGPAAST